MNIINYGLTLMTETIEKDLLHQEERRKYEKLIGVDIFNKRLEKILNDFMLKEDDFVIVYSYKEYGNIHRENGVDEVLNVHIYLNIKSNEFSERLKEAVVKLTHHKTRSINVTFRMLDYIDQTIKNNNSELKPFLNSLLDFKNKVYYIGEITFTNGLESDLSIKDEMAARKIIFDYEPLILREYKRAKQLEIDMKIDYLTKTDKVFKINHHSNLKNEISEIDYIDIDYENYSLAIFIINLLEKSPHGSIYKKYIPSVQELQSETEFLDENLYVSMTFENSNMIIMDEAIDDLSIKDLKGEIWLKYFNLNDRMCHSNITQLILNNSDPSEIISDLVYPGINIKDILNDLKCSFFDANSDIKVRHLLSIAGFQIFTGTLFDREYVIFYK